jgi:hypothetical protein
MIRDEIRDTILRLESALVRCPMEWGADIEGALARLRARPVAPERVSMAARKAARGVVCPECGQPCVKDGRTGKRTQLWTCTTEGCPAYDKPRIRPIEHQRWSNWLGTSVREAVRRRLRAGESKGEIARVEDVSIWAVTKIERALRAAGEKLVCPCGRDSRHKGRCAHRWAIRLKRRNAAHNDV